jgi:hypothetical protein
VSYDALVRTLVVALAVICGACSTIPKAGAPGEVVREESGPTKTPVYKITGMVVMLKKGGEPHPPYAADLRLVPQEGERARLGLVLHTPQQRWQSCGELFILSDGEQMPIRGVEYASTVSSNGFLEGWWIDIDIASLAKMAAAKDAGGSFCGVDWRFDEEQNATLREWVAACIKHDG